MQLSTRLAEIQAQLIKARQNAPLAAPEIAILGACKGQPAEVIEEAIKAGLVLFGENRVQEAAGKWPTLKERYPHIRLHLIGPLQTNKLGDALALFDVIQTLDRPNLALAIANELQKKNSAISQFFIQVNTGNEPQKSGVSVAEAEDFIRYCKAELKLPVVGLMCVPPADEPPAPHFALLRTIALAHGLKKLSMGMSGDFETAARMGSSCVRIGTALFGERKT